jgi:hypothetical protein
LPIFFYTVALKKRETAVSNRPPQQLKNWERGLNAGDSSPGTNFSEKFLNPSKEKKAVIGKKRKNLKIFVKNAGSVYNLLR